MKKLLDWSKDIKKTIKDLEKRGCSDFHLEWRIWDNYGKSKKVLGYIGYFWWDKGIEITVVPICFEVIAKEKIQKEFEKQIHP